MKLRFEDNSLRLRLSAEEVTDFRQAGHLETVVPLGLAVTDQLTYALVRDETATGSAPTVSYSPGHVRVHLPAALADTWTISEEVGLRGTIEVANNQVIHILVEKDLGCKH